MRLPHFSATYIPTCWMPQSTTPATRNALAQPIYTTYTLPFSICGFFDLLLPSQFFDFFPFSFSFLDLYAFAMKEHFLQNRHVQLKNQKIKNIVFDFSFLFSIFLIFLFFFNFSILFSTFSIFFSTFSIFFDFDFFDFLTWLLFGFLSYIS